MVKYYENSLDRIFFALADNTRRSIVLDLRTGVKTVTELAKPFSMSLPAISKHLKILEIANLIKREKRGRQHFFSLELKGLESVADWVVFFEEFWNLNLENLDNYLMVNKEKT